FSTPSHAYTAWSSAGRDALRPPLWRRHPCPHRQASSLSCAADRGTGNPNTALLASTPEPVLQIANVYPCLRVGEYEFVLAVELPQLGQDLTSSGIHRHFPVVARLGVGDINQTP